MLLYIRYFAAEYFAAFFPTFALDAGITSSFQGWIFGAYPLGICATSMVTPWFIKRLGVRNTIVVGLAFTTVGIFAFGFVPMVFHSAMGMRWAFLVCFGIAGLFGSLSETTCCVVIAHRFKDDDHMLCKLIPNAHGIGLLTGSMKVGGTTTTLNSERSS